MGFEIGPQEEKRQERAVRGRYQKVAVACWFTTTGRTFPLILKFEDEDGFRHVIGDIQLINTEQKHYDGIMTQRYDCRTVLRGRVWDFVLLYHPEENVWDMVLSDNL